MMPLTKPFSETVRERARQEPSFRRGLLQEAVQCYLNGEMQVGKTIMLDVIHATGGFKALSELTQRHPKSLMRMFSRTGNPQARNLFDVISRLREHEDIRFEVTSLQGAEEPQDAEETEELEGADIGEASAAVQHVSTTTAPR